MKVFTVEQHLNILFYPNVEIAVINRYLLDLYHVESLIAFTYLATSSVSSMSVIIVSLTLLYDCHTNKVKTIIMHHTVKH